MKLKIATLVVLACAGAFASVAVAHGPGHGFGFGLGFGWSKDGGDHGPNGCQAMRFSGSAAAGTLSFTPRVHNWRDNSTTTTGTTTTTPAPVSLPIPAGSDIEATACQTVSNGTTTYSLRNAEIHVPQVHAPGTPPTVTVTTTLTVTTTKP